MGVATEDQVRAGGVRVVDDVRRVPEQDHEICPGCSAHGGGHVVAAEAEVVGAGDRQPGPVNCDGLRRVLEQSDADFPEYPTQDLDTLRRRLHGCERIVMRHVVVPWNRPDAQRRTQAFELMRAAGGLVTDVEDIAGDGDEVGVQAHREIDGAPAAPLDAGFALAVEVAEMNDTQAP